MAFSFGSLKLAKLELLSQDIIYFLYAVFVLAIFIFILIFNNTRDLRHVCCNANIAIEHLSCTSIHSFLMVFCILANWLNMQYEMNI
jgi:hypothetical protein